MNHSLPTRKLTGLIIDETGVVKKGEKSVGLGDLVNLMAKCPFGEPVTECFFLPYYEMKHEHEQVAQIEVIRRKSWMKCAGFTVPVMHELMKTCKANFL